MKPFNTTKELPIFGDQSLFDKATRKNTVAIYKISENLTVEFDKVIGFSTTATFM